MNPNQFSTDTRELLIKCGEAKLSVEATFTKQRYSYCRMTNVIDYAIHKDGKLLHKGSYTHLNKEIAEYMFSKCLQSFILEK